MCIFISLLLFLMEKDWPILCKNLPRTKHFNVNPSKCGFTSPLTGLLVQIFAFHKHAQLTACYKSPAGWSKTPSPTSALLLSSLISPRCGLRRLLFGPLGHPSPAMLLLKERQDLLLHGPCVALPVLSDLVTEQMLQLRSCHILSQRSLWKDMFAARFPQPQHVHQSNSLQKTYLAFISSASEARRNFKLGSSRAHCLPLSLKACQSILQLCIGSIMGGWCGGKLTACKSQASVW